MGNIGNTIQYYTKLYKINLLIYKINFNIAWQNFANRIWQ